MLTPLAGLYELPSARSRSAGRGSADTDAMWVGQARRAERQGYIREATTKYAPGTRIVAGRNTPPELLGKRLEGELFLYVPRQTTPIPQAILDYAESWTSGSSIR